jgi:4-amino-4-deoxychorismate lyase
MKIKINDHIVDNTTSGLNNNRGLMFGDGFFTTATIKSGALVWGNHHYDRLVNSAERLMFNSFEVKPIQKAVSELCNAHNEAVIRITVYRHQNERGYAISDSAEAYCEIDLNRLSESSVEHCELVSANTPISVNPALAGIKHLNRLDSVLAASEIAHINQERLMWDGQHAIAGSRSNLFIMAENQWLTPKIVSSGINGITRSIIISMMEQQSQAIEISNIDKALLSTATSAFMTNSLIGVWPVAILDGRKLETEHSQRMKALFCELTNARH